MRTVPPNQINLFTGEPPVERKRRQQVGASPLPVAGASLSGVWEPRCTVLPNRLVTYSVYQGEKRKGYTMPLNTRAAGKLSRKASGRLTHAIRLLCLTARRKRVYSLADNKWFSFRTGFITLTLPSAQLHSDKEIHESCFKPFIRAMKSHCPGFIYLYKAEVQDNGNLHYHITTNSFIHHSKLRGLWNHYVNKLGYVDRCPVKVPNSTDVHSTKKGKSIEKYLVAYCTKKDIYTKELKRWFRRYKTYLSDTSRKETKLPKNYFNRFKRKVGIRVWDCSKCLKIGKLSVGCGDIETCNDIEKGTLHCNSMQIGDYYNIIEIGSKVWQQMKYLKGKWEEYVGNLLRMNMLAKDIEYI